MKPASDETIAILAADVAAGAMIFEVSNAQMEALIARIRAEQDERLKLERTLKRVNMKNLRLVETNRKHLLAVLEARAQVKLLPSKG